MYKLLAIGLMAITVLASCKSSKKATAIPGRGSELLYSNEWKLTELKGAVVPNDSKAYLAFTPGQENKVSGNTGCNRLTGAFVLSGDHGIKFGPAATTRMACMDQSVAVMEKNLLDVLSQASNWRITNNNLQLNNGKTVLATFQARKAGTPGQAALNGTWELNYISGPRIAFEGLFPNKKPTLVFNLPDEYASGNGSCNGYSSVIKLDGNKIHFQDPLSTMMACEGNGEPVYFKTLRSVTSYNVSGNNLTLFMGDAGVLRYTRK